jgi:hypothetical protein
MLLIGSGKRLQPTVPELVDPTVDYYTRSGR